jgi:oxygen-dependent protoporphyrinogen oxidase
MTNSANTVAIIGGGIAGLSAAHQLQVQAEKRGETIEFFVVEKEHRLGGNILTEIRDGFVIDGGPDCFISEKPATIQLCHELGIQDRLLKTNECFRRTFILWKGKLHELPEGFMLLVPTSVASFLKNRLITPLGKVRMAMDLLLPAKKSEEEESLAQFVRRRLGKEVLEKIAEPLVAGIHAGDPETMSLISSFPRFIELENRDRSIILGMMRRRKQFLKEAKTQKPGAQYTMFMTLKGGLSEITDTLGTQLKPRTIRMGHQLVAVEKLPDKAKASQWGYALKLANGETLRARAVILATPAYITAEVVKSQDPTLAEEFLSIPYVSTATASFAYRREDVVHPLNGFGFVIPRVERRKIMACTWSSIKFASRAPKNNLLLRCFVGGPQNQHLSLLSDPEIVAIARSELQVIMGITAKPLFTRVFRWEKSMPQYTLGHGQKIQRIEERLSALPGLFIAGSAYWGIGISDCIRSGKKAALQALEYLHSQPRITAP